MIRYLLGLTTALMISSCGSNDADAANTGENAEAGPATSGQPNGSGSSAATALPTTPISLADATGNTPPSVKEIATCPFLSDNTARGAANTKYELTRRRVSNDRCVWNYNIGFEVSVRVEPIASSTAFRDRTYNMDKPPVLQPMASPGTNAVMLADSTWGEPRPFAFGFEQGDKRITIYITGMFTSQRQLQAAAEEVARLLPNAPAIAPQIREETGAFDPCTTWSENSLRTLFGQPDSATVSAVPSRTACTYTIYFSPPSRNVVKVGVNFIPAQPNLIAFLKGKGWSAISGATYPSVSRITTDKYGGNAQMRGVMHGADVGVNVSDKEAPQETAIAALFANVAARVVP